MNWQAIGTASDLLAAIGVIASLLYLAAQVRTSSRIARQDAALKAEDRNIARYGVRVVASAS